jgi:hypothetical protein
MPRQTRDLSVPEQKGDADDEYAMIDSTVVRAHQHSAGARKVDGDRRSRTAAAAPIRWTPCNRVADSMRPAIHFPPADHVERLARSC